MLSSIQDRVKNINISKVEIALIVFLLLFGIPMIVLIPPGAGHDEEDHLVRVWEMSAFVFIPGQMSPQEMKYPTLFRDFAYRQQGNTGILGAEFWQKYARASLNEYGFVRRELDTKSVYPPPLLFPQAITLHLLGRRANLPALPVFYTCRFAGLLSYLFLAWLAIRLIPFGKWILLVLALSPMALFQATTISADPISNGIGFLFIAGCLKVARVQEISWRECGNLLILIVLLFFAKLNLIPLILLPFFLISPARFLSKGIYFFLLVMTVVLFLVEIGGWNVIASAHSASLLANEANPGAQLRYIVSHPFAFPQIIIKDLFSNGWTYLQGWINGYGYYYWTPPWIVSFFFLLSLVTVLLNDSTLEPVNGKVRNAFLLTFVAGYLATVVPLYATFTPVGSDQIFGVQGRYFIPLAPLLLLTLASMRGQRKFFALPPKWTISLLVITLLLNTLGIWLSFHVFCGSTFYRAELCYRPLFIGFPDIDRISQSVSKETLLVQEIQVGCNGFAGLQFWALPSAPGDTGTTRFTLQDTLSQRTLLDTFITNEHIDTEDWYPLYIQPDWHSAGKEYILTISGTNSPGEQGLKFPYTSSKFDLGNLYENGTPLQEKLILQYGCATGLQKMWLTIKP
jgi:uncharacterized membrane protein